MLVWNDLQTVIEHRLYFTKIRYIHNDVDGEKNYIFFYDGKNPYNQGYIDMWTRYVYWNEDVWDLNKTIFESDIPLVLYIYGSDEANNNYQFWSEQTIETDDEGEVLPPNAIKIEEYYIRCQEKEQVRPKDLTQDWKDTNKVRNVECGEVETELCSCGTQYRWLESGTICDGVNKHQRLRFQYKYDCDSEWVNYDPDIYKIGELIELDSDECGTYEYKEEEDSDYICGSELSSKYPDTNKYIATRAYIKRKNENVWQMLECDAVTYKLVKENSFECGWVGYKNKVVEGCGYELNEQYSFLNFTETNRYRVTLYDWYRTAPYPTNTDEMAEGDWVWVDNPDYLNRFGSRVLAYNDYDCGYYEIQWDDTDEYICGSELGDGYEDTTQYRKQVENKYNGDKLIGTTGNERWVSYNTKSCECGYRLTGYSIDNIYEYVCGDDIGMESGYMYYKTYYYEQCDDDIEKIYDRKYFKDNIKYEKASHSTSAVTTCKYDEQTLGDTTKVVTTYRTYYDNNDKAYKVVECPDKIIVDITEYEKSADCGYMEKWTVSGSVCCGYLETGHPNALTINDVEGNWLRDGNTFTSNTISHSTETIEKITFTVNRSTTLKIEYDISSESNWDKFYYSNIDGTSANNGGVSGKKTGTYSLSCSSGTHSILLRYAKDGSNSTGRDNVIVTLSIDDEVCTRYAKYNAEYYEYSVDYGEHWIIPEPIAYRYGSLIEYNSEECGYVPTLEQWVLICPDITYETAVSGDSCTICETYNNAPTMFAIEKKQISYDGGKTWEDVSPMVTRTERVLKWKADKCGYTGDTFEYRITDEYCEGGHKYGTQTTWVSSDGGKSWTKVEGSEHIVLVEENSKDCS